MPWRSPNFDFRWSRRAIGLATSLVPFRSTRQYKSILPLIRWGLWHTCKKVWPLSKFSVSVPKDRIIRIISVITICWRTCQWRFPSVPHRECTVYRFSRNTICRKNKSARVILPRGAHISIKCIHHIVAIRLRSKSRSKCRRKFSFVILYSG
jgi:hypothetical protein